jgi:hypothetical protein
MLMTLFCADIAVMKIAAAMWQMAELCGLFNADSFNGR